MASSGDPGCHDGRLLPSFFVIGPPRTGTSWLYKVLSGCTVLPNPIKETRFFDVHFRRGISWYLAHFRKPAEGRRTGEIAPTYFASADARERIARITPKARIVCIFRNPVERVLSLYRLKRAYGMIPWSFEQAIHRDPELIESGKYATHLKAWQHTFGPGQLLATVYDDLRDQPQVYVDRLADFIRIPAFALTQSQIRCVHGSDNMTHPRNYFCTRTASGLAEWLKARRLDNVVAAAKKTPLARLFLGGGPVFADLSTNLSLKLYDLFLPEVEELESILNRDFSTWKSLDARLDSLPLAV